MNTQNTRRVGREGPLYFGLRAAGTINAATNENLYFCTKILDFISKANTLKHTTEKMKNGT